MQVQLFKNKKFMLYEMTLQSTSKFARVFSFLAICTLIECPGVC